jgi:hypothetical protein
MQAPAARSTDVRRKLGAARLWMQLAAAAHLRLRPCVWRARVLPQCRTAGRARHIMNSRTHNATPRSCRRALAAATYPCVHHAAFGMPDTPLATPSDLAAHGGCHRFTRVSAPTVLLHAPNTRQHSGNCHIDDACAASSNGDLAKRDTPSQVSTPRRFAKSLLLMRRSPTLASNSPGAARIPARRRKITGGWHPAGRPLRCVVRVSRRLRAGALRDSRA